MPSADFPRCAGVLVPCRPGHLRMSPRPLAGAALGPLLAGIISPTGWNNVFYMLIAADVSACLVGPFLAGGDLLPGIFDGSV